MRACAYACVCALALALAQALGADSADSVPVKGHTARERRLNMDKETEAAIIGDFVPVEAIEVELYTEVCG